MVKTANRNATPTNFGFQYQINVAIYFMFKYLKELVAIRAEGEKEDVEITLKDKKKLMIQAKSQTKDLYDTTNDAKKLKSALKSLAEADGDNVEYLFYASNLNDPLNSEVSNFAAPGVVTKKYSELSPESRKKVDNQIEKIIDEHADPEMKKIYNINKEKLVIVRIPFFGEFDCEKYKFIIEEVKEVLSLMTDNLSNKVKKVAHYWESKFLNNSATNPKILIKKEEICNFLILCEIENMDLSNEYDDIGIEETEYYDAYGKYQKLIDDSVDQYESISKVYSLFMKKKKNQSITISEFVKTEKVALYNYFFHKNISSIDEIGRTEELDLYVAQIIAYAILKKKRAIEKIQEEAGL